MLSVATAAMTGNAGAVVSTVTPFVPAMLALPAISVATALMVVLASAGTSALLKLVLQLPPAAATVLLAVPQLTTTLEPVSAVPDTVTPVAFSAALTMLSVATALITGLEETVSSVKDKALLAAPTLPAASVWRTVTDLAPSPLRVKLVPLPASQLPPPLVLYCHVAPFSSPTTLSVPILVMPSVPITPVSFRLSVGATGGVVSAGGLPVLGSYRAKASQLTVIRLPSMSSRLAPTTASLKAALGAVAKLTVMVPIKAPDVAKVPPTVVLDEKAEMPPTPAEALKPLTEAAV